MQILQFTAILVVDMPGAAVSVSLWYNADIFTVQCGPLTYTTQQLSIVIIILLPLFSCLLHYSMLRRSRIIYCTCSLMGAYADWRITISTSTSPQPASDSSFLFSPHCSHS